MAGGRQRVFIFTMFKSRRTDIERDGKFSRGLGWGAFFAFADVELKRAGLRNRSFSVRKRAGLQPMGAFGAAFEEDTAQGRA